MQAEPIEDLLRDFLLYGQDVGGLAGVLIAPELRVVDDIRELGLNDQGVTALQDPACNHAPHVQLLSNLLRLHFLSLVTKDATARDYAKTGQLRKIINESIRDSFTQVFVVRVAVGIHKRHDRQGVDCATRTLAGQVMVDQAPDEDEREYAYGSGGAQPAVRPSVCPRADTGVADAAEPLEVSAYFGCRLVAQLTVLLQSLVDDVFQ